MKTIQEIFNKRNIIFILTYFTTLLGIRCLQVQSLRNIIEFSISFLSIPVFLIWGIKSIIWSIIIFASTLMHLDSNMLYVTLCFYTITAFFNRKYLIHLTILYHTNVIIKFAFDKNQLNINVIIYFSICILIFVLIYFYPKYTKINLNLTDDEKYILDEVIKGKQLKEIDKFSKNTITSKLTTAYKRNNLINKEELIFLYKHRD